MKYITLFETTAVYNAATLDLPNVSLIEENMGVGFNPYVAPETRVVCKYNVASTSEPTVLMASYEQNVFKSIEIDGVMLDNLVTDYTFDTTGIHTVKYELYDETKLGNQAPVFYNGNLIECIIPDIVTSIGHNAFKDCTSLTSVTIGNSVTSIGQFAFDGTNALKILNYNAKCELNTSFKSSWPNLETVIIGDSTPSIGNDAFISCTGLTSVTIGNGVTSIGGNAFKDCTNLTSIVIPDSVTSIGSNAFQGCTGLTSVTIGNRVTSIDYSAFRECSSLSTITSHIMNAPSVESGTFYNVSNDGTLYVPTGSSGYETWMNTQANLGMYNWTKVEQ